MRTLPLFFAVALLCRQVTGSERSGVKVVELQSVIRTLFEQLPSEKPASQLLNSVEDQESTSKISKARVHRTVAAANESNEVLANVGKLRKDVAETDQADAGPIVDKSDDRLNVRVRAARIVDDLKIASSKNNNSKTRESATSTTLTTTPPTVTTTRHIQGVASELARQMSANFGEGFRSQQFPCDEDSHRSLYWAKKTNLPDTRSNRKTHVLETLAYLQGLFVKYSIGPWSVQW